MRAWCGPGGSSPAAETGPGRSVQRHALYAGAAPGCPSAPERLQFDAAAGSAYEAENPTEQTDLSFRDSATETWPS